MYFDLQVFRAEVRLARLFYSFGGFGVGTWVLDFNYMVGYYGSKIYILGKQMKLIEFANKHGLRVIKCRYCKKEVIATSPVQKVCKSIGCQTKRIAEAIGL